MPVRSISSSATVSSKANSRASSAEIGAALALGRFSGRDDSDCFDNVDYLDGMNYKEYS